MYRILLKRLKSYNSFQLIKKLAALRLMPENANFHLSLDCLCHCVASFVPDVTKKDISDNKLGALCSNLKAEELDYLEEYEYLSENLFTENVHFIGGGYNVFPGISINSSFQLRLVIKGINHIKVLDEENEFINYIEPVVHSILLLSHEMSRKAGLTYGVFISDENNSEIKIPSDTTYLETLVDSVTFTRSELSNYEIPMEIVNYFCCELGSINEDYEPDQTILNLKPFINYQDTVVVVSPHLFFHH